MVDPNLEMEEESSRGQKDDERAGNQMRAEISRDEGEDITVGTAIYGLEESDEESNEIELSPPHLGMTSMQGLQGLVPTPVQSFTPSPIPALIPTATPVSVTQPIIPHDTATLSDQGQEQLSAVKTQPAPSAFTASATKATTSVSVNTKKSKNSTKQKEKDRPLLVRDAINLPKLFEWFRNNENWLFPFHTQAGKDKPTEFGECNNASKREENTRVRSEKTANTSTTVVLGVREAEADNKQKARIKAKETKPRSQLTIEHLFEAEDESETSSSSRSTLFDEQRQKVASTKKEKERSRDKVKEGRKDKSSEGSKDKELVEKLKAKHKSSVSPARLSKHQREKVSEKEGKSAEKAEKSRPVTQTAAAATNVSLNSNEEKQRQSTGKERAHSATAELEQQRSARKEDGISSMDELVAKESELKKTAVELDRRIEDIDAKIRRRRRELIQLEVEEKKTQEIKKKLESELQAIQQAKDKMQESERKRVEEQQRKEQMKINAGKDQSMKPKDKVDKVMEGIRKGNELKEKEKNKLHVEERRPSTEERIPKERQQSDQSAIGISNKHINENKKDGEKKSASATAKDEKSNKKQVEAPVQSEFDKMLNQCNQLVKIKKKKPKPVITAPVDAMTTTIQPATDSSTAQMVVSASAQPNSIPLLPSIRRSTSSCEENTKTFDPSLSLKRPLGKEFMNSSIESSSLAVKRPHIHKSAPINSAPQTPKANKTSTTTHKTSSVKAREMQLLPSAVNLVDNSVGTLPVTLRLNLQKQILGKKTKQKQTKVAFSLSDKQTPALAEPEQAIVNKVGLDSEDLEYAAIAVEIDEDVNEGGQFVYELTRLKDSDSAPTTNSVQPIAGKERPPAAVSPEIIIIDDDEDEAEIIQRRQQTKQRAEEAEAQRAQLRADEFRRGFAAAMKQGEDGGNEAGTVEMEEREFIEDSIVNKSPVEEMNNDKLGEGDMHVHIEQGEDQQEQDDDDDDIIVLSPPVSRNVEDDRAAMIRFMILKTRSVSDDLSDDEHEPELEIVEGSEGESEKGDNMMSATGEIQPTVPEGFRAIDLGGEWMVAPIEQEEEGSEIDVIGGSSCESIEINPWKDISSLLPQQRQAPLQTEQTPSISASLPTPQQSLLPPSSALHQKSTRFELKPFFIKKPPQWRLIKLDNLPGADPSANYEQYSRLYSSAVKDGRFIGHYDKDVKRAIDNGCLKHLQNKPGEHISISWTDSSLDSYYETHPQIIDLRRNEKNNANMAALKSKQENEQKLAVAVRKRTIDMSVPMNKTEFMSFLDNHLYVARIRRPPTSYENKNLIEQFQFLRLRDQISMNRQYRYTDYERYIFELQEKQRESMGAKFHSIVMEFGVLNEDMFMFPFSRTAGFWWPVVIPHDGVPLDNSQDTQDFFNSGGTFNLLVSQTSHSAAIEKDLLISSAPDYHQSRFESAMRMTREERRAKGRFRDRICYKRKFTHENIEQARAADRKQEEERWQRYEEMRAHSGQSQESLLRDTNLMDDDLPGTSQQAGNILHRRSGDDEKDDYQQPDIEMRWAHALDDNVFDYYSKRSDNSRVGRRANSDLPANWHITGQNSSYGSLIRRSHHLVQTVNDVNYPIYSTWNSLKKQEHRTRCSKKAFERLQKPALTVPLLHQLRLLPYQTDEKLNEKRYGILTAKEAKEADKRNMKIDEIMQQAAHSGTTLDLSHLAELCDMREWEWKHWTSIWDTSATYFKLIPPISQLLHLKRRNKDGTMSDEKPLIKALDKAFKTVVRPEDRHERIRRMRETEVRNSVEAMEHKLLLQKKIDDLKTREQKEERRRRDSSSDLRGDRDKKLWPHRPTPTKPFFSFDSRNKSTTRTSKSRSRSRSRSPLTLSHFDHHHHHHHSHLSSSRGRTFSLENYPPPADDLELMDEA